MSRTREEVTNEIRLHCQQPTIMSRIMLKAGVNSRDFKSRIVSGEVQLVETRTNVQGARTGFPVKLYRATRRNRL